MRQTQPLIVPTAPHVLWWAVMDDYGALFLHFRCGKCTDASQRRCSSMERAPRWAAWYATLHAHQALPG